MKSETLADITYLSANLCDTVYAHLLLDRSLSSIPLAQCNISASNRKKIVRLVPHINDISKNAFTVRDDKLDIHADAVSNVKPYLQKQFIKLIAPPNYSTPPLECVRHLDAPVDHKYFQCFYNRYVTQDSYSAGTLRLFSEMTEQLYGMNIVCPPKVSRFLLSVFSDFIRATRHAWRKIIGGLLNNELTQNAEVTNYFENVPLAAKYVSWLNRSLNSPPLLYVESNRLYTSSAYFDDPTTVLPYLLPLFDFAFAHRSLPNKLLYSCFANNSKAA